MQTNELNQAHSKNDSNLERMIKKCYEIHEHRRELRLAFIKELVKPNPTFPEHPPKLKQPLFTSQIPITTDERTIFHDPFIGDVEIFYLNTIYAGEGLRLLYPFKKDPNAPCNGKLCIIFKLPIPADTEVSLALQWLPENKTVRGLNFGKHYFPSEPIIKNTVLSGIKFYWYTVEKDDSRTVLVIENKDTDFIVANEYSGPISATHSGRISASDSGAISATL